MIPQRIQLSRARGWRMPDGAVKVDRATRWGNPFVVSTRTELLIAEHPWRAGGMSMPHGAVCTHEAARALFAWWLAYTQLGRALADEARAQLCGRPLACWCPLHEPCHADVLLAVANAGSSEAAAAALRGMAA